MLRTVATLTAHGQYEPGDIVELVVGSPHLVVLGICDDCGDVDTAYTDSEGNIQINAFPAICLELAS